MKFIEPPHDPWRTLGGEDGPISHPLAAPHRLLTLAQWHAVREHWPQDTPVGVSVANDVAIESLAADLPRLDLIVLNFPKWTDGRAYSQAHLLRARFRYGGEIRATGDVLVDMMPLLARTGFDAVVLRGDQQRASAEQALRFFPAFYQGDVQVTRPHFTRG